eukprot:45593-Rhodomonas_salina.1
MKEAQEGSVQLPDVDYKVHTRNQSKYKKLPKQIQETPKANTRNQSKYKKPHSYNGLDPSPTLTPRSKTKIRIR